MDLPPPAKKFAMYTKIVCESLENVTLGSMLRASKEAVELEGTSDITAVFDGSWQKRGHSSHNGVVTATSFLTGKVLGVIVFTKYCAGCVRSG